jgi:flavin-binding protein dodecin
VREAVSAASKSIRGITNVDVIELTCDVDQGVITRWNALVKISFPVEPR